MEPDPENLFFILNTVLLLNISWTYILVCSFVLLFLLIGSALISGSEVAFFAIGPKVFHDLEEESNPSSIKIVNLLGQSQKLLATILIANNFINIAIVILSDFILKNSLAEDSFSGVSKWIISFLGTATEVSISTVNRGVNFMVTVVVVTFILVLFGEITPKVFARMNSLKIARTMASPLSFLMKLFSPVSQLLVNWTKRIEKKLEDKSIGKGTSSDEITEAINLMTENEKASAKEADILKKIVRFGHVNITQIMKPRLDVVGLDASLNFEEVLKIVRDSEYSRLPVYNENLDSITGILHVKKFMKYLHEDKFFEWNIEGIIQSEVMFEPETKKISQLLRTFQENRKHMAVVVDEYGGTSGIITLEDVLEEILGDIYDEFDTSTNKDFKKISEYVYVFEGKAFLIDIIKPLELPENFFNEIKGEADTIAGVALELFGKLPTKNQKFTFKKVKFKITEVNDRRIEKIQITLPKKK